MRTGAPLCCFDDDLMRAASAAQARFNSTCNRRSSSVRAIAGRVRWSNTRRLPWLFSLEPRPCVQTRHLSVWFRGAILLCKSPRPAYADASIDGGWAVQGQIRRPAFLMNCQGACRGVVRRGSVTELSRSAPSGSEGGGQFRAAKKFCHRGAALCTSVQRSTPLSSKPNINIRIYSLRQMDLDPKLRRWGDHAQKGTGLRGNERQLE